MGDVLQVTGFHNSAPQFRFVGRKKMVISIQLEATTVDDILRVLTQAPRVLESSNLLMSSTICSDISTVPDHYVMYWELKSKNINGLVELDDNKVLLECCCVVEESLNLVYRIYRSKLRSVGALARDKSGTTRNIPFSHEVFSSPKVLLHLSTRHPVASAL
ncbi:putative indole-3-acetic acid-amido synthetase GH3.11 [Cardamine amara subsp. amara]|uniref:Indole-3-acetic acid-amido synthetase GH3.11 n=1 Tax=Cardamine amara subsp. amara TaxID=228776 RepID=A0ABD1A3W6_CARAN